MFYLLFCSLIWAFSYGLIKGNLTSLSPDFVAWARMFMPFVLFLPFLKVSSFSGKKIAYFLLIGAVQYGIMYLLVIRSYAYLDAYQIIVFTACTPIYVTLIGDLFSKSFKPFYLFTALMALLGVLFLYQCSFKGSEFFKGVVLVQLADICFAFGQVAYKQERKKDSKIKDLNLYALLFLGGSLVTCLSTTVFQGWGSFSLISLKQGVLLIYLGAIASGLCFFWWNKFAVLIHSGTLAVFNNVKIPLGVFVSWIVFGEEVSVFYVALSGILVGLALFLAERHSKKEMRISI